MFWFKDGFGALGDLEPIKVSAKGSCGGGEKNKAAKRTA